MKKIQNAAGRCTAKGTEVNIHTVQTGIVGNDTASAQNPDAQAHKQLIDRICEEVLPSMVRLYEMKKMGDVLDQDHYIRIIEEKVERANKSLRILPAADQHTYRTKIDKSYAENIDRLHSIARGWNSPQRSERHPV